VHGFLSPKGKGATVKIPPPFVIISFLAAFALPGCGDGERPIESRGDRASLAQKSNLSNPLKVVGTRGKTRLADRRSPGSQRPGR
jgi:hypothetical protein